MDPWQSLYHTIYILERAIKVINYSRQMQALERFNQINLDSNRLGAKSLKYKLMTFFISRCAWHADRRATLVWKFIHSAAGAVGGYILCSKYFRWLFLCEKFRPHTPLYLRSGWWKKYSRACMRSNLSISNSVHIWVSVFVCLSLCADAWAHRVPLYV